MDFLPIMGKKYRRTPREDFAQFGQNFRGLYHLYQHRPKQNKKFLIKLLILGLPKSVLDRCELAWIGTVQGLSTILLSDLGRKHSGTQRGDFA